MTSYKAVQALTFTVFDKKKIALLLLIEKTDLVPSKSHFS